MNKQHNNILFIGPISGPVTGQSIMTDALYNQLKKKYNVHLIDLSKKTLKQGISSFSRIWRVFIILKQVFLYRNYSDVVYLTVSRSISGNIKDILIYSILFNRLSRIIVHLHGDGLKECLFKKHPILMKLNKYFLSRIWGAIVLSKSLTENFLGIMSSRKIHIVPNYVEQELFIDEEIINHKFNNLKKINILYLSNLLPGKGYQELADAHKMLDDQLKNRIVIDFAGGFEDSIQKSSFLTRVNKYNSIKYHGIVAGQKKRQLLKKAHILCLPSYYYVPEGQPISILEAYASGCVVITTDHGGIKDIFQNNVNGFEVKKGSSISIKTTLESILNQPPTSLLDIALVNRMYAKYKFRKSTFYESMMMLFNNNIQFNK